MWLSLHLMPSLGLGEKVTSHCVYLLHDVNLVCCTKRCWIKAGHPVSCSCVYVFYMYVLYGLERCVSLSELF